MDDRTESQWLEDALHKAQFAAEVARQDGIPHARVALPFNPVLDLAVDLINASGELRCRATKYGEHESLGLELIIYA